MLRCIRHRQLKQPENYTPLPEHGMLHGCMLAVKNKQCPSRPDDHVILRLVLFVLSIFIYFTNFVLTLMYGFNSLNPELNPICYLLALLAHHFLHVTRIRVKSLTLRLLMSYIYGAPILDVSRSHTTTHHSR